MALQVRADLEASATAAIPETARLRRTATSEAPPTRMGRPRTSVSLLRTQPSTHSCRGRGCSALLMQHPCSRCRRRSRTESLIYHRFFFGTRAEQTGRTHAPNWKAVAAVRRRRREAGGRGAGRAPAAATAAGVEMR